MIKKLLDLFWNGNLPIDIKVLSIVFVVPNVAVETKLKRYRLI